jgi:hypothetical protein
LILYRGSYFYLSCQKQELFTRCLICDTVIEVISCRITLCNVEGTTMKKRNAKLLVAPLLVSLCCSGNSYAWDNQNSPAQNFVTGVCAVEAAVIGAVGAVALVDWCFSETDDQLIVRVDCECRTITNTYTDTMNYFGTISGMSNYISASHKPYHIISESVLYELATRVWNSGSHVSSYRSDLCSSKEQLRSSVQKLRNRMQALEGKHRNYGDEHRVRTMRTLLNNAEELYSHIAFFAECLEHHKTYFNLYDTVGTLRNSYAQYLALDDSGVYSDVIAYNLKNAIICSVGGRYPFRVFVNTIESDIAQLRSHIRSLAYDYQSGRRYANFTLDQLVWMKNAVMTDSRYAQELYDWEQARLQRLQLEALEAQARAERDRVNALYEHNRILERRNRLEQEKIWQRAHDKFNKSSDVNVRVEFTL